MRLAAYADVSEVRHMDYEEFVHFMDDAALYASIQCNNNSCATCPAAAMHVGPSGNCELHFMYEYFQKHNAYIYKE